ncbi:hypothetical protein ASPWEDRAFT_43022 [Aspergillus wentii DTO 134E9]|uniref:Uncharacterized protein n=1 Tax=Aspergillus wentii DTO 134E9 TaxID=1073089 RepID=A0A1L9RDJ0_ASPWE|nr:uncharacterized protein ASPWEDRAFT_43022 [Aspergillus wentii DTO 134E9]KAI9933253.1 hypothetical protein MW887_007726 [Aspergillus wentii]OJJ32982.1 hypothetical protein ASPWEDRAFT_43022 [Aspergillus wentii DTO 134E9]
MASMQQSGNIQMFPTDGGGCRPPGNNAVDNSRPLDPRTSLEDYNRVMLEYTQRRMSTFMEMEEGSASPVSRSSRGSNTSGNSGASASGVLARQAAAPTSAGPPSSYGSEESSPPGNTAGSKPAF